MNSTWSINSRSAISRVISTFGRLAIGLVVLFSFMPLQAKSERIRIKKVKRTQKVSIDYQNGTHKVISIREVVAKKRKQKMKYQRSDRGEEAVKSLLVVRVNFSDVQVICSKTEVSAVVKDSERNLIEYFSSVSKGNLNFSKQSTVIENVELDESIGSSCDFLRWARLSDRELSQRGFNIDSFDHKVYLLPPTLNCSWTGTAYVGCTTGCRAWLQGDSCERGELYAHELGHNLGMQHSGSDLNNDGINEFEYGDRSCPMGTTRDWTNYNAPHQVQMNWLPPESIQDINIDGWYALSSIDVEGGHAQVLRLPIEGDPESKYYISLRSASFPYNSSLEEEFVSKISVHRFNEQNGSATSLLGLLAVGDSIQLGSILVSYQVRENGTEVKITGLSNHCHNASDPRDVNSDGRISALDALIVINAINAYSGEGPLEILGAGCSSRRMVDVNGDLIVSALDALQIINYLNSNVAD